MNSILWPESHSYVMKNNKEEASESLVSYKNNGFYRIQLFQAISKDFDVWQL